MKTHLLIRTYGDDIVGLYPTANLRVRIFEDEVRLHDGDAYVATIAKLPEGLSVWEREMRFAEYLRGFHAFLHQTDQDIDVVTYLGENGYGLQVGDEGIGED